MVLRKSRNEKCLTISVLRDEDNNHSCQLKWYFVKARMKTGCADHDTSNPRSQHGASTVNWLRSGRSSALPPVDQSTSPGPTQDFDKGWAPRLSGQDTTIKT